MIITHPAFRDVCDVVAIELCMHHREFPDTLDTRARVSDRNARTKARTRIGLSECALETRNTRMKLTAKRRRSRPESERERFVRDSPSRMSSDCGNSAGDSIKSRELASVEMSWQMSARPSRERLPPPLPPVSRRGKTFA